MNLIYHDMPQGSDEWLQVRAGKFTGTDAAAFLVNGKSEDGLGAGLLKMIYKKAADYITGPELSFPVSYAMHRGEELEPVARHRYETENFVEVDQVGFIQIGDFFGFSPDGLVGEDGLIEIKCPLGPEYVRYLMEGSIPKDYEAQMQWALYWSGRKWVDYVVFNPDFRGTEMIVKRITPDYDVFTQFKSKHAAVATRMSATLDKIAKLKGDG